MKQYIAILKESKLFAGCSEEDILTMVGCLNARVRTYKKGDYILHAGERVTDITLLAQGRLHIQRDDYWGNRSIIETVCAGEMFGEAYAAPDSGTVPIDVVAVEDSVVIALELRRILQSCPAACGHHLRVVQNLVAAIAQKNRSLLEKIFHVTGRTTREKLISYLSAQAARGGSSTFTIPFNRQQLADYLRVDRSAMSAELGRMRDDGLLRFEKNRFTLL